MERFDEDTRAVIQQIHLCWKHERGLADYAVLRDRILAGHERIDVQIAALSAVVRLTRAKQAESDDDDDGVGVDGKNDEERERWNEFLALEELLTSNASNDAPSPPSAPSSSSVLSQPPPRKRRRDYADTNRRRNLATIAALWSLDIVEYYGWSDVGHGQVRVIRDAALQHPDWERDLAPRLNATLLSRHCESILHGGQVRPLNGVRLQPYRDLSPEALRAATPDPHRERAWLTDRDGSAPVHDEVTLRDLRPDHFEQYLLRKDRYGILRAADSRPDTPPPSSISSPALSDQRGWTTPMLFDAMIQHDPGSRQHTPDHAFDAAVQMSPIVGSGLEPTRHPVAMDVHSPAYGLSMPFDMRMPDADATLAMTPGSAMGELPLCWMQQSAVSPSGVAPPSSYLLHDTRADDSMMAPRESTMLPTTPISETMSSSSLPQSEGSQHSSRGTSEDVNTPPTELFAMSWGSRCSSRSVSRQPSTPAETPARRRAKASARLRKSRPTSSRASKEGSLRLTGEPTGTTEQIDTSSHRSFADASSLLLSSAYVESSNLTLDEKLHNEHHLAILSYLAHLDPSIPEHVAISKWLTPQTSWATIYSVSPDVIKGRATCEEEADILYFTSADYISHAKTGLVVRKPCIIKEEFSDQGMHSAAEVSNLLQDSCPRPRRDSAAFDYAETPDDELVYARRDSLARLTQKPDDIADSMSRLSLRSLTRAHRPLFTMLPRFRLLETLTERLYWLSKQLKSSRSPNVTSRLSFNSIGQQGHFSGVCMNASCGTWIRNLEGIKYCVLVPEPEMEAEWAAFREQGDEWVPRGKGKLIVLEEGNVLLLPPGLRVLYTMHSPTSYLVEGGLYWDKLDILTPIWSASWYYQEAFPTIRAQDTQLPVILDILKQIVWTQTDDFRGAQDRIDFLETIEGAIQNLRDSSVQSS